eukprot:754728-Hanusia_phi.AAC.3
MTACNALATKTLADMRGAARFPDTVPSIVGSVVNGLRAGIQLDQEASWKSEKLELRVREAGRLWRELTGRIQRYCSHLEIINNRLIIDK